MRIAPFVTCLADTLFPDVGRAAVTLLERQGHQVVPGATGSPRHRARRHGALGAGATEVVKVKSMVTDEMGLNEWLSRACIAAVETDLAELIVQLGRDRPSHMLVPAIHRNRSEMCVVESEATGGCA